MSLDYWQMKLSSTHVKHKDLGFVKVMDISSDKDRLDSNPEKSLPFINFRLRDDKSNSVVCNIDEFEIVQPRDEWKWINDSSGQRYALLGYRPMSRTYKLAPTPQNFSITRGGSHLEFLSAPSVTEFDKIDDVLSDSSNRDFILSRQCAAVQEHWASKGYWERSLFLGPNRIAVIVKEGSSADPTVRSLSERTNAAVGTIFGDIEWEKLKPKPKPKPKRKKSSDSRGARTPIGDLDVRETEVEVTPTPAIPSVGFQEAVDVHTSHICYWFAGVRNVLNESLSVHPNPDLRTPIKVGLTRAGTSHGRQKWHMQLVVGERRVMCAIAISRDRMIEVSDGWSVPRVLELSATSSIFKYELLLPRTSNPLRSLIRNQIQIDAARIIHRLNGG